MLSNEFKINKFDKHVYMNNTNKIYDIVYPYRDFMYILDSNDYMIKLLRKY